MVKGIYTSASGMVPRLKRQEISANNLANASTPGFKKDGLFVRTLTQAQKDFASLEPDWADPILEELAVDFTQGFLEQTYNKLNLAIDGDGFFVVETEKGERFTRCGCFLLDAEGYLVTPQGQKVLSDAGPVILEGEEIVFDKTGEIMVDRASVGKLLIVDFPKPYDLIRTGNAQFAAQEGTDYEPANEFTLRQGYLEQSNVNVIREMVEMLVSLRNYETDQKSIKMQDETLEKAVNQLGVVR